jgi:hypothetical protein
VALFLVGGAGAGGYFLYTHLKSLIGFESSRMLSLPWMKKTEETKPPEEKVVQEQPPAKAEEEPAKATLSIQSQPAGADISIDGEARGRSPLSLEVPLGSHQVRFSLKGYQDKEEKVEAGKAKEYSVTVRLDLVQAKAPEHKAVDTTRKMSTKRTSPSSQTRAGGSSAPPEQPRVVGPPPVANPPSQPKVEPKREKPTDGWIIKDLRDR